VISSFLVLTSPLFAKPWIYRDHQGNNQDKKDTINSKFSRLETRNTYSFSAIAQRRLAVSPPFPCSFLLDKLVPFA
jgi:hypothetical protein